MLQVMESMDIDELVERFQFFDEWEDRYRYLIDLGRTVPDLPAADRTEETKVRGCMSQVWFVGGLDSSVEPAVMRFRADSDSHIVKGLIAVLLVLYDGHPPSRAQQVDVKATFSSIGLDEHLSPNRRNGFFAMVDRIRSLSQAA